MSEPAPDTTTPEESLSVLERWARVKGWWNEDDSWTSPSYGERPKWSVSVSATGLAYIELWGPPMAALCWANVTPETAIAWALALDSGLPPVDVGRCPACGGEKEQRETVGVDGVSKAHLWAERKREQGWLVEIEREPDSHRYKLTCERPCPDCKGTGREAVDVARLVLDAAPRPVSPAEVWLRTAMAEAAEAPRSRRTTRLIAAATSYLHDAALGGGGRVAIVAHDDDQHRMTKLVYGLGIHVTTVRAATRPGFQTARLFVDHWAIEQADADAREHLARVVARINNVKPGADPGDGRAREHLTILAEQLRDDGHHLGDALTYLLSRHLAGDDRGTGVGVRALREAWERLTVPCERCDGDPRKRSGGVEIGFRKRAGADRFAALYRGRVLGPVGNYRVEWPPCPDCNGHGRVKPKAARAVMASTPEAPHWANSHDAGDLAFFATALASLAANQARLRRRHDAERRDFAQEYHCTPRAVGRTQRMLDEAAAHDGPVVVVAADDRHAVELRQRAAEMGAANITVVTRHAARNSPRALGMIQMWDHYAIEREQGS